MSIRGMLSSVVNVPWNCGWLSEKMCSDWLKFYCNVIYMVAYEYIAIIRCPSNVSNVSNASPLRPPHILSFLIKIIEYLEMSKPEGNAAIQPNVNYIKLN